MDRWKLAEKRKTTQIPIAYQVEWVAL